MNNELVYQFRIRLLEVEPQVWRRIQVPAGYTFWDLHVAIQDAMGWWDYHLHVFSMKKPRGRKLHEIGIAFEDDELNHQAGWMLAIRDFFTVPGARANYEYDFGDGWNHEILLEGVLLAEPDTEYPLLLAGENATPPEDCGGPWGYATLLEVLAQPDHEEYDDSMRWISGMVPENVPFRPGFFDAKQVKFDDPRARFRKAFLEP